MKNLMKKIRKSNKGFTLVELIIVVAIIALLTAVAAPQYIKYVDKAADSSLEAAGQEVETVAKAECAIGNLTGSGDITVEAGDTESADIVITVGDGLAYSDPADSDATFNGLFSDLGGSRSGKTYTISIADGAVTGSSFA